MEKRDLLNKLSVNFENIKRIDKIIASELEKRIAFAEDCVKILLNSDGDTDDSAENIKPEISSVFEMLFDIEEANNESAFVSENVIRENIFPCDYIFKCIDCAHRLIEYTQYHDEAQNTKSGAFSPDISDISISDDFVFSVYRKKTADIKISLNEKLLFSKLMSYINLCNFQVIKLNYESEKQQAHLKIDIQNKSYIFGIFIGLIKCYKTEITVQVL